MAAILEQFRVSDFLEWHSEKKLELNPEFQRGSVWTPTARSYLIDTILRRLPIPKIYLRTKVDTASQKSIREVVDGQQRLRAIIDFANDKFALSKRAEEFSGLKYSTLSSEYQEIFLSYAIAVDQLLNATDDDVLEVFARLNSYNVTLNHPELRHAKYQGEFKWAIHRVARRWAVLWDKYQVVSVRQRVRMLDDSFIAECFGVILEGINDGGQPKIDALYKEYDPKFQQDDPSIGKVEDVLGYIVTNIANELAGTPIMSAPHFLMLFAAVAHARYGIPTGKMGDRMPDANPQALSDIQSARSNLQLLASILDSEHMVPGYEEFWNVSRVSTQRISSRRIRFPVFYRALLP